MIKWDSSEKLMKEWTSMGTVEQKITGAHKWPAEITAKAVGRLTDSFAHPFVYEPYYWHPKLKDFRV